jgi:tetratricopeptide (TPR) repeat protein
VWLVFTAAMAIAADDKPPKEAATKIDWAGLRAKLDAGHYADAIAAADVILEQVQTVPRAPDFLLRSVDRIDALMRRGFAEFQLGKIDASEETFAAVVEIFKDRDFQKIVTALEKNGGPKAVDPLIDLDLRVIELNNLQAAVAIERLRRLANEAETDQAAPAPNGARVEVARDQLEALQGFLKSAAEIRKKLDDRFDKGSTAIVSSPHKRALMRRFHPELIAGITAYELSRLPFVVPPPETARKAGRPWSGPDLFAFEGLDRAGLLERCHAHLEAAEEALDEAIEAALPKGLASGSPEKRIEANVLLLQLRLARCEVALRGADMARAAKELEAIFTIHEDMARGRKSTKTENHPDLFLPLMFAAEVSAAEADALARAGKADEARGVAARAAEELARATALPLPEDHPRRRELARIAGILERQEAKAEASVATSDAADVAARRVRRAVDATAPSTLE